MDMNNSVAAWRKDHVLRFWIRRGLKMNIFPAITLPFYLRLLHLHFGGIKEVENERFNTTKEEKSLINVQEMSRSKHQSAIDVNEK